MDALLGYIVALVLSMLSLAGFTTWAKIGVTNVQTAAAASQMLVFDKAAQQYVQDNGTTLAATATATTPVSVNTATLTGAGYLPAGFSATNAFGQTWLLQVLQPTPNTLQSLVTTQGGRPITDVKQLVQVAAQAGAQGGFVPYAGQLGDASMTPANAYGAFGGWKVSLANYTNPGSGHLASLLAFGGAQVNNNYLYRVQVPGHPELNQMQTALDMTGNDINNIGNANATQEHLTGTGTPGAACTDTGAIRTSTTGTGLVICNGIWQPVGTAVSNITNGAPCANNGQIATDGSNTGYICKNNKYVLINNAVGNFAVNRQITNVTDGMTFAKDNCAGGTPWALYTPATFLVNDTGYVSPPPQGNHYAAIDQGTNWYAQASGLSSSTWYSGNDTVNLGGQLVGTFTTGCQY